MFVMFSADGPLARERRRQTARPSSVIAIALGDFDCAGSRAVRALA